MLHRIPASVVIAVASVALALPSSASSTSGHDHVVPNIGTHAYHTAVAQVSVHDGPTNTHTATLDTRIYIPNDASSSHRVPAILVAHGFGGSKDSGEITSSADFYARHDYIVLTWTAQGFGKSTGCITLDSYDYDVKDVEALIAALLQPRTDVLRDAEGLVLGMAGGSYGGGITLNVAAIDQRIRAIAPGRTWNYLGFSLDPNNYVAPGDPTGFNHLLGQQGVFKAEWTSLFFTDGNAAPVGGLPPDQTPPQPWGTCAQDKALSGDPTTVAGVPCLGFPGPLCEVYAYVAATGNSRASDRAVLQNSSPKLGQLRAATLLVQGESDTLFNLNEAVSTYLTLQRRQVPVAMTWNYGGHGGYDSQPGECEVYGGCNSDPQHPTLLDNGYLTLRTLSWFDHWLRGKPLGTFPNFTFYRDWVPYAGSGPDDEQYGVADGYPAQGTQTLMLSGNDALVTKATHPKLGAAMLINPPGGVPSSYSETSNFSGPQSTPRITTPPSDPVGEAVTFTSKPFTEDVVSVGVPSAHLHLSHVNTSDLVLFGKVFDVAPDGSTELIKRLIAPVRVPAGAVGGPVNIHLLGFAHLFKKGHAVRLTLATTDATSYNAKLPDTVLVHAGGDDPSTFTLPVSTTNAIPPGYPAFGRKTVAPRPLAATGLTAGVPLAALALLVAGCGVRRQLARRSS